MKAICKLIGINIGLIVLGLIILEFIFGNWIFGPQYGFLNIPRNTTRYFDVSEIYGGGRIQYTRDKHGLRGQFKDSSAIDVIVIGGSTTNELYVDDAKTWVSQLGNLFSGTAKRPVFANAGVDGHSTAGHLRSFDIWFPKISALKPKVVLAYIGINDAALMEVDETSHDSMIDPNPSRRWRHFMMNNSVLYNSFRKFRGSFIARRTFRAHRAVDVKNAPWKPVKNPYPKDEFVRHVLPGLAAYHQRLKKLAAAIKRIGAIPIFITQKGGMYKVVDGKLFTRHRFGPEGWKATDYLSLNAINDTTVAVCKELSIVCIDLARELKFADADFYDTIHVTPSGSARIARYLFHELRRLPFFRPVPNAEAL